MAFFSPACTLGIPLLFTQCLTSHVQSLRPLLLYILCIFLCTFSPCDSVRNPNVDTFYSCHKFRNGHAISVPEKVHCVLPESFDSVSKSTLVTVWTPRSKPIETIAVKCYFRTRTICTHQGFFGAKGIISDSASQSAASHIDCKIAWSSFLFNNEKLVKLHANLWSTNHTLDVAFKWCCKDFCYSTTNFFLEIGTISSYDGIYVLSDLGDTGGCKAFHGFCMTELFTLF